MSKKRAAALAARNAALAGCSTAHHLASATFVVVAIF